MGPGAPPPCWGRRFPVKSALGGLTPHRPHHHFTPLRVEHKRPRELCFSSRPQERSPETLFTSTNSTQEFSHPALPHLEKELFHSRLQTLPAISSQALSAAHIPRHHPPSRWGRAFTGLISGSLNNLAKGVLFIC